MSKKRTTDSEIISRSGCGPGCNCSSCCKPKAKKGATGPTGASAFNIGEPAALMTSTVVQSIPDDTPTELTFNIGASVAWAADNDGYRQLAVLLNSASIARHSNPAVIANTVTEQTVGTIYPLVAGDILTVAVRHTAGNALNILATGKYSFEFRAMRLSA